ncbi:MAG: hypothetical protein OEY99_09050 [Aigarchaeota archaeon]|nr:hypothetical protein [Aigarchaeota archaeon]
MHSLLQRSIDRLCWYRSIGQTGAWYKVATFKGTYSKTTDVFEVRGKRFRLTWSISGAGQWTVFGFFCYPEGKNTGFVGTPMMVTGSKQTTDSTIVYEGPGKFYLEVNAGNLDGWEIMVEDFY